MSNTNKLTNDVLMIKDKLYSRFVINLVKKRNFIELYNSLLLEQIDDNQLINEISKNESKYVITIDHDYKINTDEFEVICGILKDCNFDLDELSVNDVGEFFSLSLDHLLDNNI